MQLMKGGLRGMLKKRYSIGAMAIVCAMLGFMLASPAWAADFPEKGKTITLIIPQEAGGAPDVGGRLLANGLEKELGVPVVVVNKPGASTQIGLTQLIKSKPDGYTFASVTFPTSLSYLDTKRKAGYDRKSFQPLGMHVLDVNVIAVKYDSPYKDIKDLVAAAKKAPKSITAAVGVRNDDHFTALIFEKAAGIQFAHVTFPGGMAPALVQVVGGKIDVFCGNVGDMRSVVKNNQVRMLGVLDTERSQFFPDVPTMEEQGYRIYISSSRGYVLPAGTPKPVVDVLSNAIKKVLSSDDHKKRIADMTLALRYMSPEDFGKYWEDFETQIIELSKLIKD
jgi:tripartite-type tricarboxylate transporter receptor subunit TctC